MRLTSARLLHAALESYLDAQLTYDAVGATRGELPTGYHHTRRRVRVGTGSDVFDHAARAVSTWKMHRGSGLAVVVDGPAAPGETVVLGLGLGLMLVIPCRVVYVVDEPTRRGFAYGTLPNHPEEGEEAFVVTREEDDSVWLEITAFSRPAAALVRWSGPIGRKVQSLMTTRYEKAVVSADRAGC